MVIAPSKLIEEEELPADGQYYYYSLLSSRDLKPIQILIEICSRLFHDQDKITLDENGNTAFAIVEKKFHFIIQKIDPSLHLLIYFNLSNESTKQALENIIAKIKWLSFGWMSPEDLSRFEEYSDDFDVIKLYTSYDPYYLLKKFSKIQPELQDKYQERWYKPREIEVNITVPKIDAHDVLGAILQKKITETIRLKFKARFSNPGESSIVIDRDALVTHERGELKATDKIVFDVVQKTQERISEYIQYSTFREYTKLNDGSFHLSNYSPTKPFYYSFKLPDSDLDEFSIKLENLLTISKKSLQIYGTRLKRKGRDFSCFSYIPIDRSEFRITYLDDSENPKLIVDPLHTTPIGILTLTRTLSEKMSWSTELSGFYE
jgi:hypothetical protein